MTDRNSNYVTCPVCHNDVKKGNLYYQVILRRRGDRIPELPSQNICYECYHGTKTVEGVQIPKRE